MCEIYTYIGADTYIKKKKKEWIVRDIWKIIMFHLFVEESLQIKKYIVEKQFLCSFKNISFKKNYVWNVT